LIVAKSEVPAPTAESIATASNCSWTTRAATASAATASKGAATEVSAFVTDPETGITAPQADDWNFPNPRAT